MRILIAEDDEVLADGLSHSMSQSGYAVDRVKTGWRQIRYSGANSLTT